MSPDECRGTGMRPGTKRKKQTRSRVNSTKAPNFKSNEHRRRLQARASFVTGHTGTYLVLNLFKRRFYLKPTPGGPNKVLQNSLDSPRLHCSTRAITRASMMVVNLEFIGAGGIQLLARQGHGSHSRSLRRLARTEAESPPSLSSDML